MAAFLLLPLDLNGTAWQLESRQSSRIGLSFGMFDIFGYDGCNYVRGKYRSNRLTHALSTWDVSVTLIDCGGRSLAQGEFSRALAATTGYELNGDELRLYYNGGGVLIFKKRE
ncbi:MAG: META domain-containing protein [Terriglobales bacterium]